jgi:hypothetical protein
MKSTLTAILALPAILFMNSAIASPVNNTIHLEEYSHEAFNLTGRILLVHPKDIGKDLDHLLPKLRERDQTYDVTGNELRDYTAWVKAEKDKGWLTCMIIEWDKEFSACCGFHTDPDPVKLPLDLWPVCDTETYYGVYNYPWYPKSGEDFLWKHVPTDIASGGALRSHELSKRQQPTHNAAGYEFWNYIEWATGCPKTRYGSIICQEYKWVRSDLVPGTARKHACCQWYSENKRAQVDEARYPFCNSETAENIYPWFYPDGRSWMWLDLPKKGPQPAAQFLWLTNRG